MASGTRDISAFDVPLTQHLAAGLIHGAKWFWRGLGNLESASLRTQLDKTLIDRPIYIAGLARAGTTILLEIIASHPEVATHRYRDFWTIFTPVWWEQALKDLPRTAEAVERSHGDGILVTPDSPEAIEEALWMTFFKSLHVPSQRNVLDGETTHAKFEQFYADHIRKLLLARDRSRYASKGNYNITRLEYLQKQFPDARFVVPVRAPREHIASLRKQHRLLVEAGTQFPRSVKWLDRVGHFEFGCHRRPINAGDPDTVRSIQELWESGRDNSEDDVRGWARYWAHVYGYLADRMEENAALREAVCVTRFEDLCSTPTPALTQLLQHCGLPDKEELVAEYSQKLHAPTYYKPQFTETEEQIIVEETSEVAERFGYQAAAGVSLVPASECELTSA